MRAFSRLVLFNLLVIAEPLMYFRVCTEPLLTKIVCKEIKYFVITLQKIIKHFNK